MTGHSRYRELAAIALDFDATPEEAQELAAHLRTCDDCRRYVAGLQSDRDLARSWPRVHAPDRVRATVVETALAPAPRLDRRAVLSMAAALVVAVAIVAGLGWLRTTVQGPAALPRPTIWTPLGASSPFADVAVSDIAVREAQGSRDTMFAAGTGTHGRAPTPGVWMSSDGLSWDPLPTDGVDIGGAAALLASNDHSLVLLGGGSPPSLLGTYPGLSAPRAFVAQVTRTCDTCSARSAAGRWIAATTGFPAPGTTALNFVSMAAAPSGFVAVGSELVSTEDHYGLGGAAGAIVATSPDGSSWTVLRPSPELTAGAMLAVAVASNGTAVAVGGNGVDAVVWFSPDGTTWTAETGVIDPSNATVRSVAAGEDRFVAVGDEGGTGHAWVSADGVTWQAMPPSPALADARMLDVRWLGTEFVATGQSTSGDGLAWRSVDGRAWSRMDTGSIFRNGPIVRVGAVGNRYVLVGEDDSLSLYREPTAVVAYADRPAGP